jgi:hypothetical protein
MNSNEENLVNELGESPTGSTQGNEAAVLTAPPERRGDVNKCPICGSQVDAEAYHCPTCRNYFCYHCRARLLLSEKHLQCVSQSCAYYGKLICSVCDQLEEKEAPPSVYAEPEDGYWPVWLLLTLITAGLIWYWFSFPAGLAVAVVFFGVGGYLLQRLGVNIFGSKRMVEQQRRSTHFNCISCGQPAKEVAEAG